MIFQRWYWLYANPTRSEQAIEPAIAALGRRYRAQHLFPGLKHIVDFALLDEKIVIEVDGASHSEPEQMRKDAKHMLQLRELGWRVVRCTNEEATQHPDVTVADCIGTRLNHLPTLEQLRANYLAFGPEPARSPPKRTKRKPKPAPGSAPSSQSKAGRTSRKKLE